MDRGAWWATVHGVAMSRTRLSVYSTRTNCIINHHSNHRTLTHTDTIHKATSHTWNRAEKWDTEGMAPELPKVRLSQFINPKVYALDSFNNLLAPHVEPALCCYTHNANNSGESDFQEAY